MAATASHTAGPSTASSPSAMLPFQNHTLHQQQDEHHHQHQHHQHHHHHNNNPIPCQFSPCPAPAESYRIPKQDLDYSQDPPRDESKFIVRAKEPFNAEPHLPLLVNAGLITPTNIFFKRNHGPIPNIQLEQHRVYVGYKPLQAPKATCSEHINQGVEWKELSMLDLMTRWPKVTISATLQCAGNRRDGLAKLQTVKGVIWGAGTISNATWSGARLRDVLYDVCGISQEGFDRMMKDHHVSFMANDHVQEDSCYGSSIPLSKAMDPLGDVILAYEMNGETLTRDHGFPLRVVVPGFIGARSIKFLQKILLQPEESCAFYQQRDYKILPPWVNEQNVESSWDCALSLNEMNVQCVICTPSEQDLSMVSRSFTVKGYAIAGGGRAIYRVEFSSNGGKSWEPVDRLEQHPDPISGKYWAWAIWEKKINTKLEGGCCELVARAYDASGNVQPEHPCWNYRGVMNNAWSRVKDVVQVSQASL